MIIYCGDSYVWDDGKLDNWTNLLTKKLGMNSINLGVPGCSNEYIFQYQLINKVLPLLNQSPKIILYGIGFPHRFYLGNNIHYGISMDNSVKESILIKANNFTKKEWDEYVNNRLNSNLFELEYQYKRNQIANSLNIISEYFKNLGILIKFFSVDCGHLNKKNNLKEYNDGMVSHGHYTSLKEEYWLKKKYIQCYAGPTNALGSDKPKHSNHFSKMNNLLISENIYNELITYL